MINIIFFGSFQNYSVQVLKKLIDNFNVIAVITTPPRPAGRHLELKPTAVQEFAEKKGFRVYPLNTLTEIPAELEKPDFIVTAGYGKLIPDIWLNFPKIMAVNVHFSLLPYYRGAFPAEWAILHGEKETGVTLIKMSQDFDKGEILAQEKIPILESDTRETLYTKLYDLGGDLIVASLPKVANLEIKPTPQPAGDYFYAKKITRADGFVSWQEFIDSLNGNPKNLSTKLRAFSGWPGVWTNMPDGKRIKLLALSPEIIVQLEGKKPVSWKQFNESVSFRTPIKLG